MRQLTCIVCPNGCRISAKLSDGRYVFAGNKCPRGADFAQTAQLPFEQRGIGR